MRKREQPKRTSGRHPVVGGMAHYQDMRRAMYDDRIERLVRRTEDINEACDETDT